MENNDNFTLHNPVYTLADLDSDLIQQYIQIQEAPIDNLNIEGNYLKTNKKHSKTHLYNFTNGDAIIFVEDELRYNQQRATELINKYNALIKMCNGSATDIDNTTDTFIKTDLGSIQSQIYESSPSRIKCFAPVSKKEDQNSWKIENISILMDVHIISEQLSIIKLKVPCPELPINKKLLRSRLSQLCRLRIADFEHMLILCSFNYESANQVRCVTTL